jgi:hypothetical protein
MNRSSFFPPPSTGKRPASQTTKGVADFLRSHDKMAALLPAAMRINDLQRDCATILPAAFSTCSVVKFESGQLVLAVPNAALSSKLKQLLPKLQENLQQHGWQVSGIRLKLQPGNSYKKSHPIKQLVMPSEAISSFAALNGALEDSPQNAALKAAIASMLKHHRTK